MRPNEANAREIFNKQIAEAAIKAARPALEDGCKNFTLVIEVQDGRPVFARANLKMKLTA